MWVADAKQDDVEKILRLNSFGFSFSVGESKYGKPDTVGIYKG